MSFEVLNQGDGIHDDQAAPEKGDWRVLAGALNGDRVLAGLGGECEVTANDNQTVDVADGYIVADGQTFYVKADAALSVSAAHGSLARYDIVVVRGKQALDDAVEEPAGTLAVREGTAAAVPVFPTLEDGDVALAAVRRAANDDTIGSSEIVDKRFLFLFDQLHRSMADRRRMSWDLVKSQGHLLRDDSTLLSASITAGSGPHGIAYVKGSVFVFTQDDPLKVHKIDPSDLSLTTGTAPAAADDGYDCVWVPRWNRIFASTSHNVAPPTEAPLVSVNPDDATPSPAVVAITTPQSDTNPRGMTHWYDPSADKDYLFLGYAGEIHKYEITGPEAVTYIATIATTAAGVANTLICDGETIWGITSDSPAELVEIDPDAATVTNEETAPTGFQSTCDDMAELGDYIYAGAEGGTLGGFVLRTRKGDLTDQQLIDLGLEGDVVAVYALATDGKHVYAGAASAGFLAQIDPETLQVSIMEIPGAGADITDVPNEICFDGEGRLFVTSYGSARKIWRIPYFAGRPLREVTSWASFDTALYVARDSFPAAELTASGAEKVRLMLHLPADMEKIRKLYLVCEPDGTSITLDLHLGLVAVGEDTGADVTFTDDEVFGSLGSGLINEIDLLSYLSGNQAGGEYLAARIEQAGATTVWVYGLRALVT